MRIFKGTITIGFNNDIKNIYNRERRHLSQTMKIKIYEKYRRKTKSLKRKYQKIKQRGGKIETLLLETFEILLSLKINIKVWNNYNIKSYIWK